MSAARGSAHSRYAGLLPIEPSDEFVRPADLKNDRVLNRQPSLRKPASLALARFLITFFLGVAATLAWRAYGDEAREMIANSYPQLRWLAPRPMPTAQNAPSMIGLAAPATPSFDQQQLNGMSFHAMRRSVDGIAAAKEQMAGSTDQTATSVATGQEQAARIIDKIAASIATGQEQMARSTDQTGTSIAQAPSAKASSITVESLADGASSQPTAHLNIKPTEARPPQTLSERGKQLSAASGHDAACFSSASAVLQNHPGGWPTWTFRAPGHEGTMCWYAAARPRGSDHRPRASDHRREMMPKEKEIVGTTENGLSPPSAPHAGAESWDRGLP
jgi:hypothetical protein